jgi:hypothetical protein
MPTISDIIDRAEDAKAVFLIAGGVGVICLALLKITGIFQLVKPALRYSTKPAGDSVKIRVSWTEIPGMKGMAKLEEKGLQGAYLDLL